MKQELLLAKSNRVFVNDATSSTIVVWWVECCYYYHDTMSYEDDDLNAITIIHCTMHSALIIQHSVQFEAEVVCWVVSTI